MPPAASSRGIGSGLLRFVLENLAGKGIGRVELGTGSFGHQLAYYQRHGFRVHAVVKDHFLIHYPEPLMEHGIQHSAVDMLRELSPRIKQLVRRTPPPLTREGSPALP